MLGEALGNPQEVWKRTMWSLLLKSLRHNAKLQMTATWLCRCHSEGGRKQDCSFAVHGSSCSLQKVIYLQKGKLLKL